MPDKSGGQPAYVIVCTRGATPSGPCRWCNRRHKWLCDYPVGGGRTCDAKLCDRHTRKIVGRRDEDYCPDHIGAVVEELRRKAAT